MACSKIFSCDVPEVTSNIIQNFHNDINSLHSCILVNRIFCQIAIPLLWEDPFSVKYRENLSYHFIDIYLLFLNDNDKIKIINQINFHKFDLNLYKPLFHYPSLLKTLNFLRVQLHVINWLYSTTIPTSSTHQSHQSSTLLKYLQDESNDESELIKANIANKRIHDISMVLFNLFIKNDVTLNHLNINFNPEYQKNLINSIYELLLSNPTFLSNIQKFTFRFFNLNDFNYHPSLEEYYNKLLRTLISSFPSSIKHLDLTVCNKQSVEFENVIANTIQSQSQLSSIKFSF
ncbi:hypothetical protein C1645_840013, partial [Glomus cerebriforme]